jgi:hypothetical protein
MKKSGVWPVIRDQWPEKSWIGWALVTDQCLLLGGEHFADPADGLALRIAESKEFEAVA